MKERFWKFWFYLMWALYAFGICGVLYGWYMKLNPEKLSGYPVISYDWQGLIEFYIWFTALTFIPMTIIRWIATGKHFWNKP